MNELVLRVCFVATVAAARQVLFFRNIYIRLETYLSSLLIFDIIMGLHKGLIGSMPLQLFEFSDLPLQFVYFEPCHYNFTLLQTIPLGTPSVCF